MHPEQENVSKQTNELARRVKLESSEKSVKKPPHPPRSAFICFKDAKKKQIMAQNGITEVGSKMSRFSLWRRTSYSILKSPSNLFRKMMLYLGLSQRSGKSCLHKNGLFGTKKPGMIKSGKLNMIITLICER